MWMKCFLAHGITSAVGFFHVPARRCRLISSPTFTAAEVMMSRLPAYLGRKSPAPSTSTNRVTFFLLLAVGQILNQRFGAQAIAGHVLLDALDHGFNRAKNFFFVGARQNAMDRVAHKDRRLGRIENDNCLAASGVADLFQPASRGVGKLVDILPGARTGAFARDGGDDLGVLHRRDLIERAH